MTLRMLGRGSGGVDSTALANAVAGVDTSTKSDLRRVTCFGDSLTAGGQDGTSVTYPGLLQQTLPGVVVLNIGNGGWTSTEVAILAGAVNPTFAAATIPTSGAVTLTLTSSGDFNATAAAKSYLGVYGGTPGTLTNDGAGVWTFTRTTSGSSTPVTAGSAFHCTLNDDKTSDLTLIEIGRNNYANSTQVQADVAAMVAHLAPTNRRYLVLSVPTASNEVSGGTPYTQITALNAALATTYGTRYLDVRGYMIANGLAFNNITPTTADNTATAGDTVPDSLVWTDHIHPNKYGYRAFAKAVLDRIVSLGWAGGSWEPVPWSYPANIMYDGGFEFGYIPFSGAYGGSAYTYATVSPLAAYSGRYGLRLAFTASVTAPVLTINTTLPVAEQLLAHSQSLRMRSSKAITYSPKHTYYKTGFTSAQPETGAAHTLVANEWKKVQLAGSLVPTSGTVLVQLQVILPDMVAGDTVDIDDIFEVAGSVPPGTGTAANYDVSTLTTLLGVAPDGAWTTLSLTNASTAAGSLAPAYRVKGDGTVQLRGRLAFTGAYTASTTIATLPAGARPSAVVSVSGKSTTAAGWIVIDSTGAMSWNVAQTAAQVVALDGMAFSL